MAADLTKIQSDITSIAGNSSAFVSDIGAMLSILQKMDTNISSNKSSSKKGSTVNASGITSMLKVVNSLNPKLQTFSSNLSDASRSLRTLSNALQKFNRNIQGGSQSKQKSDSRGTRNSNTDSFSFTDIKDVLNGIKDEIAEFHKSFKEGMHGIANTNADSLKQSKKLIAEKGKKPATAETKTSSETDSRKESDDRDDYIRKKRKRYKTARWINLGTSAVSSFMGGNIDSSSAINQGIDALASLNPWFALLKIIKAGADVYDKEQGFGRDYARAYGGGAYGQKQFMRQSANFRSSMPIKYGFTAEDYYKGATNFSDTTGRQVYRQTHENIKSSIGLKRMGIEGDTLGLFDTFGRSMSSMDDYFNKLYGKAGSKGLSFKKMTDAIKSNLKMAQTYTFSKGVDGLQKMAETSTRLKYNMSEVAKFAEKVNTVEGAIKASANLSVLGGDFAQFSNPMGLMYESLNDMEGLNERMIEMFSQMATFDKSKGQIEISAFDKARIRAASDAMGVDANEMMNIAMNRERENIVERQAGGRYNKEELEYIKNLAQLDKKGNAYISDSEGKAVMVGSDEFEKLRPMLKKESEEKSNKENASIGDVVIQTQTIYEFLNRNLSGVSGKLGALVTKFIGGSGAKMTEADKTYLNNLSPEQKQKLYDKYGKGKWYNFEGTDYYIKQAIAQGKELEAEDKFFGSAEKRKFFNANVEDYKSKKGRWENGDNSGYDKGATSQDFYKSIQSGEQDNAIKEFIDNEGKTHSKNHVGTAGVHGEHLRILQNNESVLTGDATRRLGVKNINRLNSGDDPFANVVRNVLDEKFNYLKALSVAPPKYVSTQSNNGNQKLSIEPISLNVSGQFNLVSPNGQFRNISLDDIDTRALKKVILDTITDNIPSIMRKNAILSNKGYDMEHDHYRGSMQVPYV